MAYIAQILSIIVPILINFISKHSDEYLSKIFNKIGSIISARTEGAILIISTSPNASVEFDRGDGKVIRKVADKNGYVRFEEKLKKAEKITIYAYGHGYISEETTLEIDNEFVTYHVLMRLEKKSKKFKAST